MEGTFKEKAKAAAETAWSITKAVGSICGIISLGWLVGGALKNRGGSDTEIGCCSTEVSEL